MKSSACWLLPHNIIIVLSLTLSDLPRSENAALGGPSAREVDDYSYNDALLYCGAGQRLAVTQRENQPEEICEPCPDITYMPSRRHRKQKCLPCESPKSRREIIVIPCTNISNAHLGCATGYYRRPTSTRTQDFTCLNCHNCSLETPPQFVGRPCRGEDNTFCCKESGMEVVDGVCIHPTHTVRVCAPGYFNSKTGLTGEAIEPLCRPCTICSSSNNDATYEARPCGRSTDTVCCSRPNTNIFYNPETGMYECQYPTTESALRYKTDRTESYNTKGGEGKLTSSENPCSGHQYDMAIITIFVVLFVIFFVISTILALILGLQRCRKWNRRRSSSVPGLSESRRRRESLLSFEMDGGDGSNVSE